MSIHSFNDQPKFSLPSVKFLVRGSFRIYKKNFLGLTGIVFLGLLPTILGMLMDTLFNVWDLFGSSIGIVFSIIILSWLSLTPAALIYALKTYVSNEQKIEIVNSWRAAIRLIFPLIWLIISLLIGFITTWGRISLFTWLYHFPLLLIFAIHSLIVENQKGLDAIFRSCHLIERNEWGIVWRLLAILLILALMEISLIIFNESFFRLSAYGVASTMDNVIAVLSIFLIHLFIINLFIIYLYNLFNFLLNKKPLETFISYKKEIMGQE